MFTDAVDKRDRLLDERMKVSKDAEACREQLCKYEAELTQLKTEQDGDSKELDECRDQKENFKIKIEVLKEKEQSTAGKIRKCENKIGRLQNQLKSKSSSHSGNM